MVVLILIYWTLAHLITKSKDPINQKINTSIIGLCVMLQPSIISQNVDILNCMELDPGMEVISSTPTESCNSQTYTIFANYIALPGFFIWAFVWPLLICVYSFRRKKRLYTGSVFGKFSFFYIGYRLKYFYWDFVIIFRKVLLIILMTFSGFTILSKLYISMELD